jgi:hypothetical protein
MGGGGDRQITQADIDRDYVEREELTAHPELKGCVRDRSTDKVDEQVDHPSHYNPEGCKIETIDFLEDRQHLGFGRQNAIKYIDRSGAKVSESKDTSIRKAIWYLERELGMHRKGEL